MLLNWCCSLNIFNVEESVGGDVKKSITSSFFNRITFHLAVRYRTFQKINVKSSKLKFQTVAEKTEKNFRGLLCFAEPGISVNLIGGVRDRNFRCPCLQNAKRR